MKSEVYFAPARARRWDYSASQVAGLERLIEKMDFDAAIAKGEYVAIKTHFGAPGAHRIVRPRFLRVLAEAVKAGITWRWRIRTASTRCQWAVR